MWESHSRQQSCPGGTLKLVKQHTPHQYFIKSKIQMGVKRLSEARFRYSQDVLNLILIKCTLSAAHSLEVMWAKFCISQRSSLRDICCSLLLNAFTVHRTDYVDLSLPCSSKLNSLSRSLTCSMRLVRNTKSRKPLVALHKLHVWRKSFSSADSSWTWLGHTTSACSCTVCSLSTAGLNATQHAYCWLTQQ